MNRSNFRRANTVLTALMACAASAALTVAPALADEGWSQWRGGSQNGIAPAGNYPTTWSETDSIDWKIEIPGPGGSTPVVAGDQAFLTYGTTVSEDSTGTNHLMSVNVKSGDVKWQAVFGNDRGGKHKKGSGANPSAVTDGDVVVAYFRSGDVGCVDMNGDTKWHVNIQDMYGEDTLWWDLGSSPMLADDLVVLAIMQTGPSYLVALDKNTGDVKWKVSRDLGAPEEAAQSYSTPLAVTVNGSEAIAVMGADHLTLHDRATGKQIAQLGGFNPTAHKYFRSISSPVASGNVVVCPYARGATLTGVDMDSLADGNGKDAILWHHDDLGSDVPTPASVGSDVYLVSDGKQSRGLVACVDVKTGDVKWEVQTPKSRISFTSSPLVAGNHLYVTSENGTTFVIGPLDADKPALVATNTVDDDASFTVASPVPAASGLLLRTKTHLYRIQ